MIRKTSTHILSLIVLGCCITAWADEPAIKDIPPQPLNEALRTFADQSGLQMVYRTKLAEGKETKGTDSAVSDNQALDQLLASTGLEYRFVNDRTVAIQVAATEADDSSGGKFQPASSQVLMAQNQTSAEQSQTNSPSKTSNDAEGAPLEIEEIVVTGTHIRGVGASAGTLVIAIDREEIARSGFATTQQVIQSLPQNFRGGVNEDVLRGEEGISNITGGSAINLRGLGPSSTLTLVNGRRLPVAGTRSNFFDISTIPTSAVERIEVLPDGASAIYGSDAIAGVVNVILRNDFEGAETQLRAGNVTEGNSEEYRFAQSFGKNWGTGNGVFSYEYYKREPLHNADRAFLASSDLTPFGGDDFSDAFGNPGNILSPFTFQPAFAIPAGQDGTSLTVADLIPVVNSSDANLRNTRAGGQVLGEQARHSVFALVSQDVTETFRVFAQGTYSDREFTIVGLSDAATLFVPSANPFLVDPFGFGFSFVRYNLANEIDPLTNSTDQTSWTTAIGASKDLPNEWQLNFQVAHSSEESTRETRNLLDNAAMSAALADMDSDTAFNAFGDGSNTNPATLATLTRTAINEVNSEVTSFNATADGRLFDMSGSSVRIAVGIDYRDESYTSILPLSRLDLDREVTAVFAELFFPLIGERLSLSVAGRYEDYSGVTDVSTTDPKIGLLWSPTNSVNFRATWGTSFRAPSLTDLDDSANFSVLSTFLDSSSPTGFSPVLAEFGGTPSLDNETSEMWTTGLDFKPEGLPGFELSLTYFDIDFEDRVSVAPNAFNILQDAALFSHRLNFTPTQAELDAICNSPQFLGNFSGVPCDSASVVATFDGRRANEAVTQVEGYDFSLKYGFDTNSAGHFDFGLTGSRMIHFKSAFSANSELVEQVDTFGNPAALKMRNYVTWSRNSGLAATAFVNYTDSYIDNVSSPERKIDSWTTVDLTVSFDSSQHVDANSLLSGINLSLSALNLFDEDPPFVNTDAGGYDSANGTVLGRFVSLNVTKNW